MQINLSEYHTLVFDFDGVFTDNSLYLDENGLESVKFSRGDGYAINILRRIIELRNYNLDYFVLSTETSQIVAKRCQKLKIKYFCGVQDKNVFLTDYFNERSHLETFSGLIYIGNDLNDLTVLRKAALSLCPSDAHSEIRKASTYCLSRVGGDSFVREAIEFIIDLKSLSKEELDELVSDR